MLATGYSISSSLFTINYLRLYLAAGMYRYSRVRYSKTLKARLRDWSSRCERDYVVRRCARRGRRTRV